MYPYRIDLTKTLFKSIKTMQKWALFSGWSEQRDPNPRPLPPEGSALPG